MEFMQDNAPLHTAKIIKNRFHEHGIPLVDWPPYSPDLNPIEHAWANSPVLFSHFPPLSFFLILFHIDLQILKFHEPS